MAETVDVLANSMIRMEEQLVMLADSSRDPLKRKPMESFTAHDERLHKIVYAYNNSSQHLAKKNRDVRVSVTAYYMVCHTPFRADFVLISC